MSSYTPCLGLWIVDQGNQENVGMSNDWELGTWVEVYGLNTQGTWVSILAKSEDG